MREDGQSKDQLWEGLASTFLVTPTSFRQPIATKPPVFLWQRTVNAVTERISRNRFRGSTERREIDSCPKANHWPQRELTEINTSQLFGHCCGTLYHVF